MIQPISYSNTSFTGKVNVSMKNNSSKGVDEVLSKIPEDEDRKTFEEAFDSFTKQIEEKTPDDASIDITLGFGDWYAGGTLKSGKSVTFEIRNSKSDTTRPLCKSELPILALNGDLWHDGDSLKSELKKFFDGIGRTTISTFNFREALERSRHPKQAPKKSLFDRLS